MAFSNEILNEALQTVLSRRDNAEKAYEQLLDEIHQLYPELTEIETQLNIKSSKLALVMFSGDTKSAETLRREITELNDRKKAIIKKTQLPENPAVFCEKCGDTGYSDGKLCDCVKALAAKTQYSRLSGDMPLESCTFENFDLSFYSEEKNEHGVSPKRQMTAVLKSCKSFCDTFPNGQNILFTGRSGLGKTHLSLSIVNEILAKGHSVIYGSAQNLINQINRETFDRSGSTDKIDSLNSCDLLILDDLGAEFSTQLSVSCVYNIINTRLMRGLSTIISTNLDIKQISETYGERVASRIIGSYSICPCFGNDIRLIKAKQALK